MNRIGITVAVEFVKIADRYGGADKEGCYRSFSIIRNNTEYIFLETGPGEIQSAAAVQYLITKYNPSVIINLGTCGGLKSEIKKGTVCIVSHVVHSDYDISESGLTVEGQYMGLDQPEIRLDSRITEHLAAIIPNSIYAKCVSSDKLITNTDKRMKTAAKWDSEICEMELAGAAIICLKNKVPLGAVKVVSDSVGDNFAEIESWEKIFEKVLEGLDEFMDDFAEKEQ